MTESGGAGASYEYYIVRVYRRGLDPAEGRAQLAGVVEDGEGRQRAFQSATELINLLEQGEEGVGGLPQTDPERRA